MLAVRSRVELHGDEELTRALPSRQGIVELRLKDGRELRHHTKAVRGTAQNPMTRAEVDEKAWHLMAPILGKARARKLCDAVWDDRAAQGRKGPAAPAEGVIGDWCSMKKRDWSRRCLRMKTALLPFRAGALLTATLALAASPSSWSQSYPVKPVRLIIGGLPGTAPDVMARVIMPKVSESLGQPVIIDNRGGGAGVLAAQITAASPADGYTVLFGGGGSVSIVPFLTKKRPYDPVQDFAPVTLVAIASLVLASHPALPVTSVQDLVGLAKAKPRELLFATPGTGSIHHLTIEMLNRAAGIAMVHVPYKGGPPAVLDTMSGRVQLVVTTAIPVLPHVRAARLRALAVTGARRSAVFPEVPTVAESGVPGFESLQWFALFAPRNAPAAVAERLFSEVRAAAQSPSVAAVLAQEGMEQAIQGPRALAEFHRLEIEKWQQIILHLRRTGVIIE